MLAHAVTPANITRFLDLREAAELDRTKARSTPAFDLTFAILTMMAIVGLYLDIWSHITYGADQSIFSEYHLLFYAATIMAGCVVMCGTSRFGSTRLGLSSTRLPDNSAGLRPAAISPSRIVRSSVPS